MTRPRVAIGWFPLLAVVLLGTAVSGVAKATPGATSSRLQGADRYATAAEIAATTFPTPPPDDRRAVLVRGDSFADALSAGAYASTHGRSDDAVAGPIILTTGDRLHPSALDGLRRSGVSIIEIAGGEDVVSAEVEAELRRQGFEGVGRTAGADRYETAVRLNDPGLFCEGCSGYPNGIAFIASGEDFPDALAAGPIAWRYGAPVLLTQKATLPEVTRKALENWATKVFILGGEAAVSAEVEDQIRHACRDLLGRPEECIEVERMAGDDRQGTALKVAEYLIQRGSPMSHVILARGDNFPDAIAGGPHGGKDNAPILLTQSSTELGATTRDFLRTHAATIESIHVLGSQSAVSDAVLQDALAAVRSA